MSRSTKHRKLNNSIAIIVDGQTEKWYLEKVKVHYSCDALKSVRLEPQLPQHKKIKELIDLAEQKANDGYKQVFLVIDFDEVIENKGEFEAFQAFYQKCDCNPDGVSYGDNVKVIINNPCLEYWHLLHFIKTGKYYSGYNEMEGDLQKVFSGYNKGERFYCGNPDIYTRLGGDDGLAKARENAIPLLPFSIQTCKEKGVSEMGRLFDYFDTL